MRDTYPYVLTQDQYVDSVFQKSRANPPPPAWRHSVGLIAGVVYGGLAALAAYAILQPRMRSEYVLAVVIAILVAAFLSQWVATAALRRSFRRGTYRTHPRYMSLHEHGLRLESALGESFYRWEAIADATIRGDMVFVNLDAVHFEPVPIAAFESATEAAEFVAFVNARSAAAREANAAIPPPTEIVAPAPVIRTTPPARSGLRAAVGDAVRIAFFLPVDDDRPSGRWAAVFVAALASLALPILASLWFVGAKGEWSLFSLPSVLVHIPLLLAAAIGSAYAMGMTERVSRIFMAGLLVSIVIDFLWVALNLTIGQSPEFARFVYLMQWIPAIWLALAVATYACRLVEPGVRRLGVLVACALFVALPLTFLYRDRTFWRPAFDANEFNLKSRRAAGGEDAFYAQPGLLAQELAAVRPGTPGVIDVFHIGFAGYADQDVFRKEVDAVARIFRERFGAEGHAIRLVNNPKTLLELPIASKTSLRAALTRVAEVMDKDEDVLVLFMTSHGSKQHQLSLTLAPLAFHEIDPAVLRQLLDESGIRNRVVVVSACYSGGFVKPLANEDTLVMTASDASRPSFGCTNEAEWTYFGKAYFDEALRATHSFRQAFEAARPVIAEREAQAKFDSSDPQISMGSRIATKLADLERQLETHP
jgi:hypothetical protein